MRVGNPVADGDDDALQWTGCRMLNQMGPERVLVNSRQRGDALLVRPVRRCQEPGLP